MARRVCGRACRPARTERVIGIVTPWSAIVAVRDLARQMTDQDMTAARGLDPFWLERRSGGRGTRGQHALRQGLQLPDVGFR
jgi:hypothetical protein